MGLFHRKPIVVSIDLAGSRTSPDNAPLAPADFLARYQGSPPPDQGRNDDQPLPEPGSAVRRQPLPGPGSAVRRQPLPDPGFTAGLRKLRTAALPAHLSAADVPAAHSRGNEKWI